MLDGELPAGEVALEGEVGDAHRRCAGSSGRLRQPPTAASAEAIARNASSSRPVPIASQLIGSSRSTTSAQPPSSVAMSVPVLSPNVRVAGLGAARDAAVGRRRRRHPRGARGGRHPDRGRRSRAGRRRLAGTRRSRRTSPTAGRAVDGPVEHRRRRLEELAVLVDPGARRPRPARRMPRALVGSSVGAGVGVSTGSSVGSTGTDAPA